MRFSIYPGRIPSLLTGNMHNSYEIAHCYFFAILFMSTCLINIPTVMIQ